MNEKINAKLYKLRWVLIAIFVAFVAINVWFASESLIWFKYLVILGVIVPGIIMAYSFASAFTKIKWKKWVFVCIILIGGLFWYHQSHKPKVVYMKEDVLYIKPTIDTTRHD